MGFHQGTYRQRDRPGKLFLRIDICEEDHQSDEGWQNPHSSGSCAVARVQLRRALLYCRILACNCNREVVALAEVIPRL